MSNTESSPVLNAFLGVAPPRQVKKRSQKPLSKHSKKAMVTLDGVTQSVGSVLQSRGLSHSLFSNRVSRGDSTERALRPVEQRKD